ncbi:RHS repeat-associated core domain-containing protein [Micromonospora rubida]|uniref:RHS repeat-associated core domain-containing protein n=1 Tax=Micromonospora rubida TaxID=2697657 RepID=UPI001378E793|nr:RHS repeat-associated core domain-containing protein [Micromonospora rubida]NBE82586.1 hypothetical protein [Micromonospora rubida]
MNSAGYTYDALGRTKTVPAIDTGTPTSGSLTVTYHATDLVDQITQNGRTTDYTPDVGWERVRSWTDNVSGIAVEAVNHYSDDGDNPSWTQETLDMFTRPVIGVAAMAGIYNSESGEVQWQVASLHGDLVATINEGDDGLSRTSEATEYGAPRDVQEISLRRYGWLGAEQRAADTPSGVLLMGVRLYSTVTARFFSVDGVYGGSSNPYEYCSGDGVNCTDLTGYGTTDCASKWWKPCGVVTNKSDTTYMVSDNKGGRGNQKSLSPGRNSRSLFTDVDSFTCWRRNFRYNFHYYRLGTWIDINRPVTVADRG